MIPSWWTKADTEAVERYAEWGHTYWYPDLTDDMDPEDWSQDPEVVAADERLDAFVDAHAGKWTCRRCRYWTSGDGISGECSGPEIALGRTDAENLCEQWMPRVLPAQEELAL